MPQITKAQPRLAFLAPKFNLLVLRLITWMLPDWLKYKLHITRVDVSDIDRLVEVYKQSQMGRLRLIIAFRHPSKDDYFCLGYLAVKILPLAARKHRIVLRSPIFVHFVYNAHDALSVGKFFRWLYSRLGSIPIYQGRADRMAIETARDLLINGEMPIAIPPEGRSNGQSEFVSPLESVAAQIGFETMEALAQVGREEDVLILPIGIQYYYLDEPWQKLEEIIAELETACGLIVDRHDSLVAIGQADGRPMRKLLYNRFYHLSQHLLYQVENFYAQFYQYQIPTRPPIEQPISRTKISQRIQQLVNFALAVSESYFNLKPQGSTNDRYRQIERAGWGWIYREELTSPENLSPVSRKLADRIATEADLRMWHMRIVESFVAVTSSYVKDRPTIDRFSEVALLLWDIIAQIQSTKSFKRPILGDRRVHLTIGNAIPLSDYWDRYKSGRRQAKQAKIDLTQELRTAMEGSIDRGEGFGT